MCEGTIVAQLPTLAGRVRRTLPASYLGDSRRSGMVPAQAADHFFSYWLLAVKLLLSTEPFDLDSFMKIDELKDSFLPYDEYRPELLGYAGAIDHAMQLGRTIWEHVSDKAAEGPVPSPTQKIFRGLGAIAQLWKDDRMPFLSRPSTLGQTLVLGTLGAAGGYGLGRMANKLFRDSPVDFARMGMLGGGLIGALPGVAGGTLNHFAGKPVLTSSFWDAPPIEKRAAYAPSINVQAFDNYVWSDPSMVAHLPPNLQAAASGLVRGAANLPGKVRNSSWVTPGDIARMAMGMGAGAMSGWVVGQTLGTIMGLNQKNRDRLTQTGAIAGVLKQVIPMAYGAGEQQ